MKVLQINSVCGVGSTGRIATDIHSILINEGHNSYIGYGRDTPRNCESSIRIGSKYDNYSHALYTRLLDKHGFGSKKATKQFIEKIVELNPDVIHLHNIHGYYINIKILFEYLKTLNKPIIWTLHDCWSFTGHCAYFDYVGCERWKKQCYECPQKNTYPESIFLDNSKNNYLNKRMLFTGLENLTIVTPSKWLADKVQSSFLNTYNVKVINNGIDLNVFKPTNSDFRKRRNLENKFIILGVASTWEKRKGLNYFIELSHSLDSDEVILLVGLSETQMKDLPKNIIGIPRTNNIKELAEIYTASDVFVNPTLEEVMGLTNVEALACGTPVITFNTGGSVECVDDDTGIIVEKGDLEGLRTQIKSIKNGNKLFDTRKCLERVVKYYNKDERYAEYVALYKSKIN